MSTWGWTVITLIIPKMFLLCGCYYCIYCKYSLEECGSHGCRLCIEVTLRQSSTYTENIVDDELLKHHPNPRTKPLKISSKPKLRSNDITWISDFGTLPQHPALTLPSVMHIFILSLFYSYSQFHKKQNKTHSEPDMKFNSFCFFSVWSYDLPLLCLAGQATDNSFLVFVSTLTLSSCNSGTAAIKDLMERCLPKSSLHNRTDKLTRSQACLPTDKQVRGHNSTISWDDITDKCVFHTHHIFHSLC